MKRLRAYQFAAAIIAGVVKKRLGEKDAVVIDAMAAKGLEIQGLPFYVAGPCLAIVREWTVGKPETGIGLHAACIAYWMHTRPRMAKLVRKFTLWV